MFAEHPEYIEQRPVWEKYRDLYTGGEQMKQNASHYLLRRQKEPTEVYGERLERVFYENYIGSIIDWYAATLFRREPQVGLEGGSGAGRDFFNELQDDCDLRGTNLTDYLREQITHALVFGAAYTLVDFPKQNEPARNRAEEDALGASRAYLKSYSPLDLVNWSYDSKGHLEWAVLRTERLCQEHPEQEEWVREQTWTYYDRTRFKTYCLRGDGQGDPELVDEGLHGLAKLNRVPLFELRLSEGLWMMRKAALVQVEHFNKSNALGWALTMGLFAMPVVYSDREFKQMIGESYYIQLGPEDKFGWTEPQGTVFQLAADNLSRLQREIYRICYLLSQAGGAFANGQSQSGLSKQRDYAITQEVLRALGDRVKDVAKSILRSIEAVREDGLVIDVAGLDEFDIGEFGSMLDDAERLLKIGIDSPTLREQVQKRLAFKFLSDIRSDLKDRISREIDASVVGNE